jgi:hypothetical protein
MSLFDPYESAYVRDRLKMRNRGCLIRLFAFAIAILGQQ